MKKLNKREIILGIVSLGLLVIFLLVQKVIKPLQQEGEGIDQQMQVSQSRLLKVQKTLARGDTAEQWHGQLVDLIGSTDSASGEVPSILSKIQLMASEDKLSIAQIQPQRVVDQDSIFFMPVQLELTGQWPDIARFLARIQAAPDYFFINELSLQKNTDNSGNVYGRITLSRMKLKTVL